MRERGGGGDVLGHLTRVNVFPASLSAYWRRGELKCSRTKSIWLLE